MKKYKPKRKRKNILNKINIFNKINVFDRINISKKINKKYFFIGLASAILIIVLFFLFLKKSKENSIFYISKIILYNSADVISNSDTQYLRDLKICQFSDICVYIENNIVDSKLTDSNTIKKLYIDNINISSNSNAGEKILNYKSPSELGKYVDLSPTERLDFEIIKNNKQNTTNNYSSPTFYTDCSNPLFLGYVNKNIVDNFSIRNNDSKIYYNAKILKEANIDLNDINNNISFDIHITNNRNHNFVCHVNILSPLDEDFLDVGYSYIINSLPEDQYKFKRE